MKPIYGRLAIVADERPLDPHVTLRLAGETDDACDCGNASTVVVLGVDRAVGPPRLPELEDRACYSWLHIYRTACAAHVEPAIRDASRALHVDRPYDRSGR